MHISPGGTSLTKLGSLSFARPCSSHRPREAVMLSKIPFPSQHRMSRHDIGCTEEKAALTVISCHLDAGGCGEEAVPVLPAAHARPLVEVVRVVVVEGVVARGVGAVLRRALEATDPAVRGCKS